MSNDDFRVSARSNSDVRSVASRLRAHFGISDAEHVDVLNCADRSEIWTVKGVKPLRFEVVSDDEMKGDAGLTSYDGKTIIIQIPRHIRHRAFLGDGFARNTIVHEFGHGAMHFEKLLEGAVMARRSVKNTTPRWIPSYESSEHQARIFAPAFLINETIARNLTSIEDISIRFGISYQSAEIYFEQLQAEKKRPASVEHVRRVADELIRSFSPKPVGPTFLTDCCTVCHKQTVFPVGGKFMCQTCDTIYDRFQDGD